LIPYFSKAGLINHQHATGIPDRFADVLAQHIAQVLGVPDGPIQQILHGIGRALTGFFGQLPSIFAFDGTEQTLQVGLGSLARF